MISMIAFRGSLELGLVYALLALGLFVSYRVLDVADLTVDGSFTLGAAVCAVLTVSGHPILALFAAMLAGVLAGCFTAFLQTKLFVQPILAGIISMTALYSVNLRIMGNKPNISI
ncbi:MAG: ABC transporter permease, partial [Oscillospiraceae bacterium]